MELDRWPDATSDLSNTIFVASAVAFVMPQEHQPLLTELERVLGARRYNYLVLFLGFIRFAHFWTESHPPLHVEDDSDSLLADQRALAEWVTTYRPRVEGEVAHARAELDELEPCGLGRARAIRPSRSFVNSPIARPLSADAPGCIIRERCP